LFCPLIFIKGISIRKIRIFLIMNELIRFENYT
jgi:hypothetical protein